MSWTDYRVLSSCTGSQEPIKKTQQFSTAEKRFINKGVQWLFPLCTDTPGHNRLQSTKTLVFINALANTCFVFSCWTGTKNIRLAVKKNFSSKFILLTRMKDSSSFNAECNLLPIIAILFGIGILPFCEAGCCGKSIRFCHLTFWLLDFILNFNLL